MLKSVKLQFSVNTNISDFFLSLISKSKSSPAQTVKLYFSEKVVFFCVPEK